jgi:RNA polymerase-binding transcription factor DksA
MGVQAGSVGSRVAESRAGRRREGSSDPFKTAGERSYSKMREQHAAIKGDSMTDWAREVDDEDESFGGGDETPMEDQAMHVVGGPPGPRGLGEDFPDGEPVDALLRRQHYLTAQPVEEPKELPPVPTRGRATVSEDWARARLAQHREASIRIRAGTVEELGSGSQRESLGELTTAVDHFADDGSETNEIEVARSLIASLDDELRELAEAESRLARGRYGFCERCGKPIPAERLDAVPATRYCVADEAMIEESITPGHLR